MSECNESLQAWKVILCLHESRGPVCIYIITGEKTAKKTGVLYDSVVVSSRFRWKYHYCRTMVSRQHQRLLCHSNDESGICLTHSEFLLTTNQDFVLVSEEPWWKSTPPTMKQSKKSVRLSRCQDEEDWDVPSCIPRSWRAYGHFKIKVDVWTRVPTDGIHQRRSFKRSPALHSFRRRSIPTASLLAARKYREPKNSILSLAILFNPI